ncbi:MAG: DMT family transporter [Maricaulaceae bacterium]
MIKTLSLTALALIAFAANSLLARAGLIDPDMGPKEFTLIRLISGAIMLMLLIQLTHRTKKDTNERAGQRGSWWGAAALLVYALMFSLAYVTLDTGFGALCLFTSVQLTILGVAAIQKNIKLAEIIGALIAFAGFIYLVIPTLGTPNRIGIFMMALSGIAWGLYTVLGRGATQPLLLTSGNFIRASFLAAPLLIFILPHPDLSAYGVGLAIISGALTSGCGYAIWYAVLPRLSTAISGVSQLLVPPIAAFMGWVVLGENLSLRLLIATAIILLGLYIVVLKPDLKRK